MENKIKIDCILGIDPGAQGGIAVYIPGQHAKTVKMPKDVRDLRDFFQYYAENYRPMAFLEKLSVRPDDVKDNPGKIYRIQQMLANFEHLKVLLESAGIPYVLVHPISWQTKLKLRIKGQHEEKAERKRRYKEVAEKNYPEVKVTPFFGEKGELRVNSKEDFVEIVTLDGKIKRFDVNVTAGGHGGADKTLLSSFLDYVDSNTGKAKWPERICSSIMIPLAAMENTLVKTGEWYRSVVKN